MDLATVIGGLAALCTTVSYFPQLQKCWNSGSAGDLSYATFSILAGGLSLWVVYGVLNGDMVIVVANSISVCLQLGILFCKLKDDRRSKRQQRHSLS